MDEIVRCVEALQLSYEKSIATPANWPNNHKSILIGEDKRTTAFRGSVFLLPTVSAEDADKHFPNHVTCDVPSGIPYLRLVKARDVGCDVKKLTSLDDKMTSFDDVTTSVSGKMEKKESAVSKKKGILRWLRNK